MKQNGFTLIELMIVICILGIVIAAIFEGRHPAAQFKCEGGYKFSQRGEQIIGKNGGGVPCDEGVESRNPLSVQR